MNIINNKESKTMGKFDNRKNDRSRDGGFKGKPRDGGFRNNFGPREMHKAVCDECKQECEVPFKPTEGKPVFCKECYAKKRQSF